MDLPAVVSPSPPHVLHATSAGDRMAGGRSWITLLVAGGRSKTLEFCIRVSMPTSMRTSRQTRGPVTAPSNASAHMRRINLRSHATNTCGSPSPVIFFAEVEGDFCARSQRIRGQNKVHPSPPQTSSDHLVADQLRMLQLR